MNSFQWIDAKSVDEAVTLLSADERGSTIAKAGGMDLLDLIKEGIVAPARIVNLQRIDALRGVQLDDAKGLRLGSLTTLAEIASNRGD
jgi:xanthine dehydrogenase YagS FAD-binding subunit